MKTSYYLLIAAILITLTGMVTTDVLLKREYEKIDWSNPYQFFARRPLPAAKHIVIEGTQSRDILVETGPQAQALVAPEDSLFFSFRMQHDTLHVSFNPDTADHQRPIQTVWNSRLTGLVLRLPAFVSVNGINTRLTIQDRTQPTLDVSLQNSVLFANKLTASPSLRLTETQNSFAILRSGSYKAVEVTVQDSSEIHLDGTRIDAFTSTLSDRAEVRLTGQANRWVKRNP
ncbi:hypothetical protein [Spirosoma rhododendri]|uniref:Uncharacterized protein n=1 Tax=Spirosoma rhododendri TaxID=2728024 RepID=A0A7L5DNE0_9BACT|nr:hypothetical protein [Spirosoma rhododendri]QJD79916.1 hypothetical protein HH216_16955 [Spirosoma rhododendri]